MTDSYDPLEIQNAWMQLLDKHDEIKYPMISGCFDADSFFRREPGLIMKYYRDTRGKYSAKHDTYEVDLNSVGMAINGFYTYYNLLSIELVCQTNDQTVYTFPMKNIQKGVDGFISFNQMIIPSLLFKVKLKLRIKLDAVFNEKNVYQGLFTFALCVFLYDKNDETFSLKLSKLSDIPSYHKLSPETIKKYFSCDFDVSTITEDKKIKNFDDIVPVLRKLLPKAKIITRKQVDLLPHDIIIPSLKLAFVQENSQHDNNKTSLNKGYNIIFIGGDTLSHGITTDDILKYLKLWDYYPPSIHYRY